MSKSIIEQFTGAKAAIPSWVGDFAVDIAHSVERIYTTPQSGQQKKKTAKAMLLAALKAHDIAWLPDDIESAIEESVADVMIERAWRLLFKRKRE